MASSILCVDASSGPPFYGTVPRIYDKFCHPSSNPVRRDVSSYGPLEVPAHGTLLGTTNTGMDAEDLNKRDTWTTLRDHAANIDTASMNRNLPAAPACGCDTSADESEAA